MTPVELVLSKLPDAKPSGNGWSARCPAHDDRRPSLSVSEGDDGRALVRCHAGCPVEKVTTALGLNLSDLMPARVSPPSRSKPRSGPKPRSNNWLSLFTVGDILVDRKTAGRPPIHVRDAAVWVVGSIQPGTLRRALGAEHRESGLAARPLMTFPPRVPKRWTEDDIDPSAVVEMGWLLGRLYELQPAPGDDGRPAPVTLHLTPEGKAVWVEYFNAHADEQAVLTGDLSAAWSKLEEYAARLALVVHYARWAAKDSSLVDVGSVDVDSMRAGIALTEWSKPEARRVYAMLDESDAERDDRRLTEWVKGKGGTVTVREVQQGCSWLKQPGAAEAALDAMVKAGRGDWRDRPATDRGGRPTRVFVLRS